MESGVNVQGRAELVRCERLQIEYPLKADCKRPQRDELGGEQAVGEGEAAGWLWPSALGR